MTDLKPLPVAGYTAQSTGKVALVNTFKQDEERLLRKIDEISAGRSEAGAALYDGRWAAIARTHIQEGFMALNRSVFQPQRIALPEDAAADIDPLGR